MRGRISEVAIRPTDEGVDVAAGLLQVFEAAVPLDLLHAADPELRAFYEGPAVMRVDGLFAHWFGVAERGDEARIALVSGWESTDALVEFARANRLPRRTGPVAQIVALGRAEAWELLDQVVSTFEPGDATTLHMTRAEAAAERLDAVVSQLLAARDQVPAQRDVAVSELALRREGETAQLLVLTAWRTEAAMTEMQALADAWWGRLARDHEVRLVSRETFALRPPGVLRLTPRGAAVVITDDRGMIADATPAAVGMLGRSVWDLFQLRFDDLPRELDDGTFLIARPEGGALHVHVVRAANVPAPGRHAALLIPGFEPRPDARAVEVAIAAAYRRGAHEPDGSVTPPEAEAEAATDDAARSVLPPAPAPSLG